MKGAFIAFSIFHSLFATLVLALADRLSHEPLGWAVIPIGCGIGILRTVLIFKDPVRRSKLERIVSESPLELGKNK